MSGDSFGHHKWSGRAPNGARMHPPPPMQMYPVQNVNGAEVEKSIESISRSVMTDSV